MAELVYPLKVPVVSSLPSASSFANRCVSFNNRLYYSDGTQWIKIDQDADTVDGFHASQTPNTDTIPVSLSTSRIATGFIPELATYSKMTCGTSVPSSPSENELFYHTTNRTLQKYVSGSWYSVDWQTIVKASPEWIAERLRIQSNQLQISPDGTNWYDCIPAVGASAIQIATVDNTNFNFKYFILPYTMALLTNVNHAPFTFIQNNVYRCTLEWQVSSASDAGILWVGNISSTVYNSIVYVDDNNYVVPSKSTTSGLRLAWLGYGVYRSFGFFEILSSSNYVDCISQARITGWSSGLYGYQSGASYLTNSSSIWWLGTFRTNTSGTPLSTVQRLVIFKEA